MKELPIYGRRNGKNGVVIAHVQIDDEDLEKCNQYRWNLNNVGYVRNTTRRGQQTIEIQRLIMDFPKGKYVDHKDHNPLNNQKSNLRICDNRLNQGNQRKQKRATTSKFKGVYKSPKSSIRPWTAQITINKRRSRLGCFENEVDAARAYNEAAIKCFGDFACLNEIPNMNN